MANPELFGYGFETLTRGLRTRAWDAVGDRGPAPAATAADPVIIDLDATLVTSHSDNGNVAATYKGGYGFAPFIASVEYGAGNGSGEILAAVLRPGNAGANSAEDHIEVFHTAAAQLPDGFYDEAGEKVLVRTGSAGSSRKFLWHLHSLGVQFSTSYTLPFGKAHIINWINDKSTGSRTWTSPETTGTMRGSSTPPTSSRSSITRRAPNSSSAPNRCTPARSRPCSMPTGTGSPRS